MNNVNLIEMKIDLELQWIKTIVKYEEYQLKYGVNPEIENMSTEEKIEYVCNREIRYKLFEILDKYINPNLTEEELSYCSKLIKSEHDY